MLPLYVMAGGQSRRFGRDKARALCSGKPLILHVVDSLAACASRVTVVTDQAGKYEDLGLRSLADFRLGRGPLAGLERALADLAPDEPWLLLVSCDFVGARPAWVADLMAARGGPEKAVSFASESRFEPLFALYHAGLADLVRLRLEADQPAMQSFLRAAGATAVPYPKDWSGAVNVNTLADLEHAKASRQ